MSTNPTDPRRQYPSTYFVDRSNQDEMTRLIVQATLPTFPECSMSAVAPATGSSRQRKPIPP